MIYEKTITFMPNEQIHIIGDLKINEYKDLLNKLEKEDKEFTIISEHFDAALMIVIFHIIKNNSYCKKQIEEITNETKS